MRKMWWKWTGIIILGTFMFLGMVIPLNPGINKVTPQVLNSGVAQWMEIEMYHLENVPTNGTQVILKKEGRMWKADSIISKGNKIMALIQPSMGKDLSDSLLYSVLVKVPDIPYIQLTSAVAVSKSRVDTGAANFVKKIAANIPEKIHEIRFPNRGTLQESIRNLLYHVPMWFAMILLLLVSIYHSIKYLNTRNIDHDFKSAAFVHVALLAGICGTATGSVWASVTWNTFWSPDPKLNGVTIGMLMYFAYLILRNSIADDHAKARIASVYNLFVFPIFIALIYVMPRLTSASLHPGSGDTVTFKEYDLDNTLKMFFYPAVIGWTLFFAWIASNHYRRISLKYKWNES